jgi:hypothetical protein
MIIPDEIRVCWKNASIVLQIKVEKGTSKIAPFWDIRKQSTDEI